MATTKLNIPTEDIIALTHDEGDKTLSFDGLTGTSYFPGYSAISYPATILFNPRGQIRLDYFRIFNTTNTPSFDFLIGSTPFNLTGQTSLNLSGFNTWNQINIGTTGNFFTLAISNSAYDFRGEIEVWGEYLSQDAVVVAQPRETPNAEDILGCNGFNWDISSKWRIFKNARFFHNHWWASSPTTSDEYYFYPGYGGSFNGDTQYQQMLGYGVDTTLCLQNSPKWFINKNKPLQNVAWSSSGVTTITCTTSNFLVNDFIFGTGIAANTYITAISSSNNVSTLTINNATTSSSSSSSSGFYYCLDGVAGVSWSGSGVTTITCTANSIIGVGTLFFGSGIAANTSIVSVTLNGSNQVTSFVINNATTSSSPSGKYYSTCWDTDCKPITYNSNPYLPSSYNQIARTVYQYAARYGTQPIPSGNLNVYTGNTYLQNQKLSGLNYAKYIEIDNEPDKWWKYFHGHYFPYQYAAYLSACYDGHEGTLSADAGIKKANPWGKVVMSGLAGLNLDYIYAIMLWSKYNRTDGKFPSDVINFHSYASTANQQQQAGSVGASPEAYGYKSKVSAIVTFRNKYLPNVEIWVSEFGYDTNNSVQQASAIGSYTKEQVQGIWNIRTYIELLAAGVDKAFVYYFADANTNSSSTNLFELCGVYGYGASQPDKGGSFYYRWFSGLLRNKQYRYVSDESSGTLRKYKFKDISNNYIMYLIWDYQDVTSTYTHVHSTGLSTRTITVSTPNVNSTLTTTPTNLSVSSIGNTTATISWNASSTTYPYGAITYYVYKHGNSTADAITTSTSANLTGLTIGKTYTYYVIAVNDLGQSSLQSDNINFTTTGTYTQGPSLETYWYLNFGSSFSTSVTNYNNLFIAQTALAANTAFSNLIKYDGSSSTIGLTAISGVSGSTTSPGNTTDSLYYSQTAKNSCWNTQTSIVAKFTGLDNSKVYNIRFFSNSGTNTSAASVTINGTTIQIPTSASNNSYIEFTSISPSSGEIQWTFNRVSGYYQAFLNVVELRQYVTSDTTPPTTPSTLTLSSKTDTRISMTWTGSTDDINLEGYNIYRNSTYIGKSLNTTYTDTGLTPSTQYTYTIKAVDTAGNLSTASNSLVVTTNAYTAPVDNSGLSYSQGSSVSITVSLVPTAIIYQEIKYHLSNDPNNDKNTSTLTSNYVGSFKIGRYKIKPVTYTGTGLQ